MSDYLQMGDDSEVAVRADTRNKAREQIASLAGIPYIDVKVRHVYLKPCDCQDCEEDGPLDAHGYDEFWRYCSKEDPEATGWWVG